ncbi:N(G),N(G)-dimethylarginine dimethylaminohydrolase 1-like [Homarus americanus]|uniref:N(G),N(G)-dimethylarginine dimethylaminohydrolase 1-like n=1 Tax=Homarus americanus TaxID=6706 RepID=A0A8J5KD50_HOMAM|nr:N(G),N(G)-dimethylarginine dimethylaminohydrolase 1-like [Homarus americanus]
MLGRWAVQFRTFLTMSPFRYTHAVVCRIPDSFKNNAVGISASIDLAKARKQHEVYVATLREIGLDVIELPADENHPDCVFVEDVAVVCNGTALLTKPGHPSRKNEVEYMRTILKNELELPVIEISDETATLDGGDVGHHLHLKCCVTMAGPDVMCVGSSPEAKDILKRIEREATFRYQTLTVPDDRASNVVFANGYLIHHSAEEFPAAAKVFEEKLSHWTLKPITMTEIGKAQGDLTCCSILIRKTRHLKNIM